MVVVRIVVAALSCPPSLLPLFGPCLWARRGWGVSGCPSPPLVGPCSVCGAGGPWPSLVAVLAVWGVGAGLGGVGVVSAH